MYFLGYTPAKPDVIAAVNTAIIHQIFARMDSTRRRILVASFLTLYHDHPTHEYRQRDVVFMRDLCSQERNTTKRRACENLTMQTHHVRGQTQQPHAPKKEIISLTALMGLNGASHKQNLAKRIPRDSLSVGCK